MRKVALLLMSSCAVAQADSKADVEKLVRAHVAASVSTTGALVATLAEHRTVVGADGNYIAMSSTCETEPKSEACNVDVQLFGNSWVGDLKYANVRPIIRVDDAKGVAVFYVTADLSGKLGTEGMDIKGKTKMRIAGVARRDKAGWKIVAAKYSASLPDRDLLAHGESFRDVFEPKPGIETEVTSWFGHLAEHQSASAIGANGTAPSEVATDKAGMTRLARSWDKLDLKPYSYVVEDVGDTQFVWMDVTLTTKKKTVDLAMAVVAVKEGAAWKWLAIDFGPIMMTEYSFR